MTAPPCYRPIALSAFRPHATISGPRTPRIVHPPVAPEPLARLRDPALCGRRGAEQAAELRPPGPAGRRVIPRRGPAQPSHASRPARDHPGQRRPSLSTGPYRRSGSDRTAASRPRSRRPGRPRVPGLGNPAESQEDGNPLPGSVVRFRHAAPAGGTRLHDGRVEQGQPLDHTPAPGHDEAEVAERISHVWVLGGQQSKASATVGSAFRCQVTASAIRRWRPRQQFRPPRTGPAGTR